MPGLQAPYTGSVGVNDAPGTAFVTGTPGTVNINTLASGQRSPIIGAGFLGGAGSETLQANTLRLSAATLATLQAVAVGDSAVVINDSNGGFVTGFAQQYGGGGTSQINAGPSVYGAHVLGGWTYGLGAGTARLSSYGTATGVRGYARCGGAGTANLYAYGKAGFSTGAVRTDGANDALIGVTGGANFGVGALAFGYSRANPGAATILAGSKGALAGGYAGNGGTIRTTTSNNFGARAGGAAVGAGAIVEATAPGASAFGYATVGYVLRASAAGSGARGSTAGAADIIASAVNAWQFGPGTNATATSLQVGTAAAGIHLLGATSAINIAGTQVLSTQGAAVPDPVGGGTVDAEARTAISDLLARCRAHGLIAT